MIMIMIMKTNTYVTDCITQNKVSTLNIYLVRPAGYIASLLALTTNEVYLLGRDSHMKGAGCSLSLLGLHVKRCVKIIHFQFVLFTRFMQFRFTTVSFRVKKKVGPRSGWPLRSFRVFIQFSEEHPRPFHMESPREYIVVQGKRHLQWTQAAANPKERGWHRWHCS